MSRGLKEADGRLKMYTVGSGEKSGSQTRILGKRRKRLVRRKPSGDVSSVRIETVESHSIEEGAQAVGIKERDPPRIELGLVERFVEKIMMSFSLKNAKYFLIIMCGVNS